MAVAQNLPGAAEPPPRRVVVFRHGILLNRFFMRGLEGFLVKRGYEVHNRSYPTTRKLVEEHARDLADELIEHDARLSAAGEPYELFVVTHSLGGLVLRYAMRHFSPPTLSAAVQLVPPNQGSATARYFWRFPPYRWIYGTRAGGQLAGHPPGMYEACGVPNGVPVGIIAGLARWRLYPNRLEKPHDGVVSLSEARLPPLPLKTLPFGHTPILFRKAAWEEVAYFLEHKTFKED